MERQMRWMLAVALCAGCSGSGTTNKDLGVDSGSALTCTPDGKTATLAPLYGVQANLNVNVKITPGCSGASCIVNTDATAKLLLLADVSATGTTATVTARPCKIVIPKVALKGGNMPVILTAPDSLVASVKAVTSQATLGGTMTCAQFNAQPITLALGANLASPASDPLPMFAANMMTKLCGNLASTPCLSNSSPAPTDTGCVCDQEMDGKLGATLSAMNAPGFDDIDKIYVDLRTSVTLAGQLFPEAAGQTNPGARIEGKVANLKLDENVLGCHRNLTGGAQPRDCDDSEVGTVAGFTPAISQSANADSTFLAVPLAAGATCADLVANEATLFQ